MSDGTNTGAAGAAGTNGSSPGASGGAGGAGAAATATNTTSTDTTNTAEATGGGYSVAGSGSEVSTSSIEVKVQLNSSDLTKDLVVGLFGGTTTATGVTGASVDITANGTALQHPSYGDGASAAAGFTDHALDLGSLSGAAYATGSLDVLITLSVTTSTAGAGFHGGVIVTG